MSHAVLIFTFSPIQSFISQARRTADLYAGSRILAELARAALEAIACAGSTIVYPARAGGGEQSDTPNKLVAVVPRERAADLGRAAEDALHRRWSQIVAAAGGNALAHGLPGHDDPGWQSIWRRQTAPRYLWQCFWAAARIGPDGYKGAYQQASRALDAAKRSRLFLPAEEWGTKDSLSGQREALHRQGERASDYWRQVSNLPRVTGALLRPFGRERLDAIGTVKRFWPHRDSFLSTSSIASQPFLDAAREQAPAQLQAYRQDLGTFLGRWLHEPRTDPDWPYDGDLLFQETLTPERLQASYRSGIETAALGPPLQALKKLHRTVGFPPSPYYAVVALDGDSVGEHISKLLEEGNPQEAHCQFGQKLSDFADVVQKVAALHSVSLVYNGGDDVLALAPASSALPFAHELAQEFHRVTAATASAGIAIAHHLSPLDAALEQAHQAQNLAKDIPGKDAVCVTLMRRGGEAITARGPWCSVIANLDQVTQYLAARKLSARLPYDIWQLAYAIPDANDMLRAELRRLVGRRAEALSGQQANALTEALGRWAEALTETVEGLAQWLIIARFLAGAEGGSDAFVS
ncbi:MAG: type III-B CRISPR-associated protein Cas10/Cmr2 [Anaerolineae bacterium]|nr:type III-B CRISPR-associated protein Cas10/Cmr2 [Anaerolineae bacterium]